MPSRPAGQYVHSLDFMTLVRTSISDQGSVDRLPSIVLLVRDAKHFLIVVGIAVRVDARVVGQVIPLPDSPYLLGPTAVATDIPSNERPILLAPYISLRRPSI